LKVEGEEDLLNWLGMHEDVEGLIASEYLPGRNYACKVLYIDGQLSRAACAERISYLLANVAPSGVSGMCARGRLVNNSDLIVRSDKAVRLIFRQHGKAPHGMFTVDFKEDGAGIPKLTEINVRPVSFTYAFALAGANFAHDMLEFLTMGSISGPSYLEYRFAGEPHFIRGVDAEIFVVSEEELVRDFSP
jgi:carbamoyl-phosphate synthase large subunit